LDFDGGIVSFRAWMHQIGDLEKPPAFLGLDSVLANAHFTVITKSCSATIAARVPTRLVAPTTVTGYHPSDYEAGHARRQRRLLQKIVREHTPGKRSASTMTRRSRARRTQAWRRWLAKSALPRRKLHELRHTHATHMLSSGVHPKIASERLGHCKVGSTLDLHSHVLAGMQEDAPAKVDAALKAALNKRETKG